MSGDLGSVPVAAVVALALPAVIIAAVVVLEPSRSVERTLALGGLLLLGVLFVRERVVAIRRQDAAVEAERRLAADRATIVQLVSHEFRTPLTMIRGGVETVFAHADIDDRFAPVVDAVERATVRLDGMLGLVLAAADRFEVDEYERLGTRLESVIDDVVRPLPDPERGRVRVAVTTEAGVQTNVARRGIVALLLQTILDNGLKFSAPAQPVEVHGHVGRDEVVLRVVDRGPGVPEDFVDRAFEMFTQQDASTSRPVQGLGLGLFTARRLATRLGGTIELHPGSDGAGAVAEVRLPRVLPVHERVHRAATRADRWHLAHR